MTASDNPLLSASFPIPFDRVTPAHVQPAVDELLADARARMDAAADPDAAPSFEGTMLAVEAITEQLSRAMRIVGHLEGVATTDELRAAYNEAVARVSELEAQIPLSEPLWAAIKRYADCGEARQLEGTRKRFLDKTIAYFRRHGADLGGDDKRRLAEIDVELTKMTVSFSQRVLDATNAFELLVEDEQQLAGLPPSAKQAARANAESKGKTGWRFTLQAPSYVPAATYLDDASIRERLYRARITRATAGEHDNRSCIERVLELRAEKARLLGFDSFADFVTDDRMAGNAGRVREFIDDLRARTESFFRRETERLHTFRRELEGDDAAELKPWDVPYYAEKLRRALYDFDDEVLRPYFPFKQVLDGMFQIARRLYGVGFEPWRDAPSWHHSVTAYKLVDADSDEWLASVLVDPYPREAKQAGAWMDGVLARGQREADHRHVAVLVANITPPVREQDALLSHREVETMFHEFGHLLHHCLSHTELRSHAGTAVAWDFVELPSQIFENWCWEREALDLFARHHQTGEPLPEELVAAMRRARTFRAASAQMAQLGFASTDLALHVDYRRERDGDALQFARAEMQKHAPTPLPDDYAMLASFDHLFGSPVGYAAGYYSYKWAEVLDADAFGRFKREGLFSSEVGRAFKDCILARGDEDEPEALFRAFMGRDPKLDALLERLGILERTT